VIHRSIKYRAGFISLSALVLFMLSACSVTQQKPSPETVPDSQSLQNFPADWTINGRISMIHKDENWYARFNWIQQNQDFQISFTGPLGETELQLSQIEQNIRLKTPSIERSSDNLEQLLFQETGWKFPVTSLRYWSHGQPDPNAEAQLKYNEQQQISDIYQAGWHIRYPKRMSVDSYLLPKKIIATEQDLKIKIIISNWLLGEAALELDER